MAKSSTGASQPAAAGLFPPPPKRRHLTLFIPTLLAREAERPHGTLEREHAQKVLLEWADLIDKGYLLRNETALDADFLQRVFGDALDYRSATQNPADYHREKSFPVAGVGIADGALGKFAHGSPAQAYAVIELKGAGVDLDHDKFNGRTPVQQCWDYLNQLPDTPWGIVSNYTSIRLYHRNRTTRAYEEFDFRELRDPARFIQFYYIFERHGLIGNKIQKPRSLELLTLSENRQREVGDKLYNYYSEQRLLLIESLIKHHNLGPDKAIHAAQLLLDRIIFIAFCEDRGLLPSNLIEQTWKNVAPLARATNPRWRNFLDAFHAIDQGHAELDLPTGYNGGLFRKDELVDNLDLEDRWTDVFRQIGEYDFREEGEINVDVLGNLFERSVNELEKLRVVGLFGVERDKGSAALMPKSAERKRFGIYYTPPEFTRLIVDKTLGVLVEERVEPLADPAARAVELRRLKICDPACGSGAFLIAAYERLRDAYEDCIRLLRKDNRAAEADELQDRYPDSILKDNIHGMDLSEESVEITRLALWIRSARKGKTLADLSENIRVGNSLITDPAVHPKATVWSEAFPVICTGRGAGFDVVIGNPPWERLKLQEREYFSLGAPEIAAAVNAADRRAMIAKVEAERPDLWAKYNQAKAEAERILAHVRSSGEFRLTGRGDVNTYMLFAELARKIVAPNGRVGLLVPSGIATDNTTKHFFNDLVQKRSLIAFYDFENHDRIFPDVDGRFKFCVLLMSGRKSVAGKPDFVFFARNVKELAIADRHISLTDRDLKLVNPNTRTCPIFRTRRDAELTKGIYRNVPVLIDESRRQGGNPWGVKFFTMFHQTNDAELFKTGKDLKDDGFRLEGNRWIRRKEVFLPVYEAKMIQAYDHRAAGVVIQEGNWMRQGQTEETTLVGHQNSELMVLPRYWVDENAVLSTLKERGGRRAAFIGFKDITSSTNQRTIIAAAIPWSAVTNHFPILLAESSWLRQMCLLANLNSMALDYLTRQKIGAVTLNFFIVEQLPIFPPDKYDEKCPWRKKSKLETWISERALKLTCTSEDMVPLAEATGLKPPIHKWKEEERATLKAELDAAFFILYGIERADVEYILGTFQGIANENEAHGGAGATQRLILDAFDSLL